MSIKQHQSKSYGMTTCHGMTTRHGMTALTTAIATFLILALGFAVSSAEEITAEYTFERPSIRPVTMGTESYDHVTIEGLSNSGEVGEPYLPASGARILLPPGADVESVEIIPDEPVVVASGIKVEPAERPVPLSSMPTGAAPPVPKASIYESNDPFPAVTHETIGTHTFRGYRILVLKLYPVQYYPVSGELSYFPRLTVKVTTRNATAQVPSFRGLVRDQEAVERQVDNPEIVSRYPSYPMATGRGYDMLILTTSSLASAFEPLRTYHNNTGLLTEIRTTSDVGSNDPDDVRDYIRDRYNNDGIQFVLIGGDDDIIPAKDLYVISWEGDGSSTEYNMPGDIYFACLDGTWNYDGDSYVGEPGDGESGTDVDLIAEVYVGRASVSSSSEASRFVEKTLEYLSTQSSYLERVLLCGEYLGFGGVSDYAGNMMDEMVDSSYAGGSLTVCIPSDKFTIDELYDRDWSGNDWPTSEIISRINSGRHIINHLGHGYNNQAMKMYNSTVANNLTNNDLAFVYTQACLCGHFDNTDCWAEYMSIKTNHAAFALVANSRYGWGAEYSTDGPSQRYNRQFWDAVFNPNENKPQLGPANHDSKEDNLYRINESCMRWCYYETNLFGDPAVHFRGLGGLVFDYPDGTPSTVTPGETTDFQVNVSGVNGGDPVAGSGQLHYRINGGSYLFVSMSQTTANHYTATIPALSCDETIEFYVSAEETVTGRVYDPLPSSPNRAVPVNDSLVVFSDNFETDQGWSVSGDAADGQWERGVPANGNRGDPPTDYDGSGQCYLTGNVAGTDIDDGTTYLDSPVFDLSDRVGVVHYARWYCNDYGANPNEDVFVVYVSNDAGTNWEVVDTIGPAEMASGGWYEDSFRPGDYVSLTDQMKVRFEASDLGDGSVVEAAIDDFRVYEYLCGTMADSDEDGVANSLDNCPFTYNPYQEDGDEDGYGDVCDNCETVYNPDQADSDGDEYGNLCDNCPDVANPDQIDADDDGYGAACDCDDSNEDINPETVWYADGDSDGFGAPGTGITQCEQPSGYVLNNTDNCPSVSNPGQTDTDQDGFGDACDAVCCMGERTGNIDCDGEDLVDMGDLTVLIDHLFISLAPLSCVGEADVDLSGQPNPVPTDVDMGDLTVIIDHLFISLDPLPLCPAK